MREALRVIGTERHESRRIDNQLRGRSGRQGDPGSSQFYLSLEDDLMRLFGGDRMDRISGLMQRTEIDDDMPIQAKMVTKGIESAQRQVEAMHFSSRKHVLEYDDVMDKQRKTIYAERNDILDGKSYADRVPELITGAVEDAVFEFCPSHDVYEDWDIEGLNNWFKELTGIEFDLDELDHQEETNRMIDVVSEKVLGIYEDKKDQIPPDIFDQVQNQVMLRVIDTRWMSHLSEMDYLRAGIGLRAVGQREPISSDPRKRRIPRSAPSSRPSTRTSSARSCACRSTSTSNSPVSPRTRRRSTAFRIRRPTRTSPMRPEGSPAQRPSHRRPRPRRAWAMHSPWRARS